MEIEPDLAMFWSGVKNWLHANIVPVLFVGGVFLLGAGVGAML